MTAPVPKPLAVVLHEEMGARMVVMDRHLKEDDPQMMRWQELLLKVREAMPPVAALCQADLFHMMGNTRAFEDSIGLARRLGVAEGAIYESQLVSYANLSFATKGLSAFHRVVDVSRLNVGRLLSFGVSLGSFQRIEQVATQAANAKIDLSDLKNLPDWIGAAKILRKRDFSDENCAKVIDAAGVLLRERELFWLELAPRVLLSEELGEVVLRFRLNISSKDASEMTGLLVNHLIDTGLDEAPLLVNFVGVKQ